MSGDFLYNSLNGHARQPFKKPNPHEIPTSKSFYKWLEEINEPPTNDELQQEKLQHEHEQDMLNDII